MLMEFCEINALNTTTMLTLNSGTNSADALFDRTETRQYSSYGLNNDATANSIRIDFASTQTVDRIVLQNINWKSFVIYYNGTTTVLPLASGCPTSTASFSSNSATNMFLYFSTLYMTSLSIYATTTMVANAEKKCGQIWVLEKNMTFERNPSAREYKAVVGRKQIKHDMADGGIAVVNIAEKFRADIDMSYVTDSFKASLRTVYDDMPKVFIPFPTGTSWNDKIYEVNWIDDWGFDQPEKDYYLDHGWKGTIRLRETPL